VSVEDYEGTADMATLILDPDVEQEILAQRAAWGGDRFDEVWEGTYMMSPLADNEHQRIQFRLAAAIQNATASRSSQFSILCGANITDRENDWKQNYRCPDVLVFGGKTAAKDCGTHWLGGPDFAVEITSPADRSRDKLGFYAKVGVQELLLIDRSTWTLELYRLTGGQLQLEETSSLANANRISSRVLNTNFRLIAGQPRPTIEVTGDDATKTWPV
jgi:Uma2 family endonuclease